MSDGSEHDLGIDFVPQGARNGGPNETVVMAAVERKLEALYPYMKGHLQRVSFEASALGEEIGLSREELEQLRVCSYLLDIGMIDESIHTVIAECGDSGVDFMQNGEARHAIERHPYIGAQKLETMGFSEEIVLAVKHHHEWYNGWGYPDGMTGVAIPLLSRLLSVADAYVAIQSDRPFGESASQVYALEEIVAFSDVQFDPWVVAALESVVTKEDRISESLMDISPGQKRDELRE